MYFFIVYSVCFGTCCYIVNVNTRAYKREKGCPRLVHGVQVGFVSFERTQKQLSGEYLSHPCHFSITHIHTRLFRPWQNDSNPAGLSVNAGYVYIPYVRMCALFKQHLEIILDRSEALG